MDSLAGAVILSNSVLVYTVSQKNDTDVAHYGRPIK